MVNDFSFAYNLCQRYSILPLVTWTWSLTMLKENRHGCVPMIFYLQKEATGKRGHCWPLFYPKATWSSYITIKVNTKAPQNSSIFKDIHYIKHSMHQKNNSEYMALNNIKQKSQGIFVVTWDGWKSSKYKYWIGFSCNYFHNEENQHGEKSYK